MALSTVNIMATGRKKCLKTRKALEHLSKYLYFELNKCALAAEMHKT